MHLLYLHDQPVDSGKASVIQVLHMCAAFSELGMDVSLLVPAPRTQVADQLRLAAERQLGKEVSFSILSYPIWRLPRGRFSALSNYLGIRSAARRAPADWIFVRAPLFLNAVINRRVPIVFEFHHGSLHDNRLLNRVLMANLLRNVHGAAVCRFVAISQKLADRWIRQGVPARKLQVLHDGVDRAACEPAGDVTSLRRRLRLPPDRKMVVYSGSLFADRGIERVLDLAQAFPDACFVLLGGPEDRATHYRERVRRLELENVRVLGPVPHGQVRDYLAAADVLLMIWSRSVRTIEFCSPLKMFEYMAAGRIIVGDGYPTIREVLQDGRHALLADPDSFADLQRKMKQALSMPYPNPLARAAQDTAREQYTWTRRAQTILETVKPLTEHLEPEMIAAES